MKTGSKLWALVKLAFQQLRRNKTRAFLTMLGIIIGVSSVILLLAIGSGLKIYIRQQFTNLGSNMLYVMPGQMIRKGHYQPRNELTALSGARFTWQDVQQISHLPAVKAIAPVVFQTTPVSFANRESQASLIGTTAEMFSVRNLKLQTGRFFSHQEEIGGARVVILGSQVAKDLFGPRSPLGERVVVNGSKYRVLGVLRPQGGLQMMGSGLDSRVYLPYKDVFRMTSDNKFPLLVVQAAAGEIDLAKREITLLLGHRYHPEDFSVTDQAEILATINSILGVLTMALAGIAAISLLVGGIGIMNIMFVSVSERVREIGLRKAVGATATDIQNQFLLEAVVLSLSGGVLGVVFGFLGAVLLDRLFPARVSWWSVLLAFFISTLIGIIFGVIPARRAARLSPIEALRYE